MRVVFWGLEAWINQSRTCTALRVYPSSVHSSDPPELQLQGVQQPLLVPEDIALVYKHTHTHTQKRCNACYAWVKFINGREKLEVT